MPLKPGTRVSSNIRAKVPSGKSAPAAKVSTPLGSAHSPIFGNSAVAGGLGSTAQNAVSQTGVYGLQASSSDGSIWPHVTNYPGSRYGSGYWFTSNGTFWLLGGEGFDSTTTAGGNGLMNDLFRYLPYP
jgi:hypothetical protein